ncbi:hypothetical protein DCO58_06970 [Helicobacter saguini]|uniref:Outer membrane protein beta-barrel domain-containing protein n=1 Tax=Helicobacter saguini TaxID=1548018 RepID=A0A347VN29_9HELI|nr:hypothetical protein [Helicobacter saguini]MWV61925.1 hypothetical protein [Helicobacter saguini]MWV67400.1 hypothetical protein [Helicobacter saguini]MWV69753.1 hypothetical protein [Helicobacter saguini]MWV73030.1 hypothetical protein [Helicobacter saguini]TLD95594.1 hypothetical protein LS64_001695 [Helicobacter saguini]
MTYNTKNLVLIFLFFYFLESKLNADEMIKFNENPKNYREIKKNSIEYNIQENVNLWEQENAKVDILRAENNNISKNNSQSSLDFIKKDSKNSNIVEKNPENMESKPQITQQNSVQSSDTKDILEESIQKNKQVESHKDSQENRGFIESKLQEQYPYTKDSKNMESKSQNTQDLRTDSKIIPKELSSKEQKRIEKEQLNALKKQEKLIKKAEKNKAHITSGKNIQEVRLKRDFGILGSTISLGINYEMLGLKVAWLAQNTATPPQTQTFSTNINLQNIGLTWGYQFVGRNIHLLTDTRLNLSYNLIKSDQDILISADQLFGYYFPFNSFSGVALKAGATLGFSFDSKKITEIIENKAFGPTTSRDILTFFGVGSKVGLEINLTRFSLGTYFMYYHFYMATFENLSDNFIPFNSNANAKSGGYGFQAILVYRFKKVNNLLHEIHK